MTFGRKNVAERVIHPQTRYHIIILTIDLTGYAS